MYTTVSNLKIHYEQFDCGGEVTLLLHGFGANCSVMKTIYNSFVANNKSVVALDLPMFGLSDNPDPSYTIYDYAQLVTDFVAGLGYSRVNILAHSFGCRVALIMAYNGNLVNKLVITGGAGLKPRRKPSYYFKVYKHKFCTKFFKNYKAKGSVDYNALDPTYRPLFNRVVNTHLDYTLKKINNPTLLIWGEHDVETPLYMANKLKKKLSDCGLVVIKGGSHYAFLDSVTEFNIIVNSFL